MPTATELRQRAKVIAPSTVYSIESVVNALRYGTEHGLSLDDCEKAIRAGIPIATVLDAPRKS